MLVTAENPRGFVVCVSVTPRGEVALTALPVKALRRVLSAVAA